MKKIVVGITAASSVILLEGQLKYFKDLSYETYLIAPDDERTRLFCGREGCHLLPVNIDREISLFSDVSSLFQIIRYFRKIKPDIVNVGTPKMGLLGIIAAKLTGVKKRIYTCRGYRFEHEKGFKKTVLMLMERITAMSAQNVICISQSVRTFGIENKLFPENKAVVIYKGSSNGIDLKKFNGQSISAAEAESLRQQLDIKDSFVFGYIGRLIDRKGINELFNAFENLYLNNQKIKLLIVGSVETEQIADKTLIDRMYKHPGVYLAGPQLNVPLYLSLMDVFVLPAWWEGFGNVLIQAAAMGVPVISTNATGTRDAMSHNFNGLMVKPKSVVELENAMKLLMEDKELRLKLGKNGIEWAGNFNSEIIWQGMKELFSGK